MQARQHALLNALEIPIWLQRTMTSVGAIPPWSPAPPCPPAIIETPLIDSRQATTGGSPLQTLRQCVADCQLCPLAKTRTQTVFGVGNEKARLMIIGEAPGFHEDQQGEPFVGRAGQLLNAMLHSIGYERKDIYIANILKCRPPNNRDPLPEEVAKCTPYLQQQIALIQPQALCAVGRIAAQYLLETTLSLSKLRGNLHYYGDKKIPLFITYHPAYLLRNPSAKSDAYQDLLQLNLMLKTIY